MLGKEKLKREIVQERERKECCFPVSAVSVQGGKFFVRMHTGATSSVIFPPIVKNFCRSLK